MTEFDLPIVPCLVIVSLSAMVNLALQIAFNPMERMEPVYAAALLALNIVELAALLYFTGGLQNPFSFLFLAPVLISATALPVRLTIALAATAIACAPVLLVLYMPLPWDAEEPLILPPIYLFGVWLSILLAIGVTSLYAFQVTEEARKLSDALAATELVLAREQHLTQLDGLAAAAAHELGTPLSTIALVSRELVADMTQDHLTASQRAAAAPLLGNRRGWGFGMAVVTDTTPQGIPAGVKRSRQSLAICRIGLRPPLSMSSWASKAWIPQIVQPSR